MIPLAVPNLVGREAEYLQRCVDSTFVSSVGPFVEQFEHAIAAAAGATGAVAVSSGTTGLHLALTAIGVRRGDLVILPSLTFIASANAIAHCGADPWLFDIAVDSWTLDPTQVERTLERRLDQGPDGPVEQETGRRLAAIMPVHTLGHPADLEPLAKIGHRFGVPIVADAAAALGARYRGQPIGAAGTTASVFSFNGNKTVTSGGGGAVASDDPALLRRARHLSTTARVGEEYDHDEVGYNYRMTNLQAAVGCAQLEQLDDFVATKRRVQATYHERLTDLPGIKRFPEAEWAESAAWFAGVVLEGWTHDGVRALRADLRQAGIDARPFWKPMHHQRPYADAPREDLAVTEGLWPTILTLPCSTGITDDELDYVATTVRDRLTR